MRASCTGGYPRFDRLRRLYIPESLRGEVADHMRATRGVARIDVRVDRAGNSALLRMHVDGATFGN
ncbi:MAG: hypothetical protein GY944_10090 [bacterium]|nr:hypothetical protein [bacterium]